MVLRIINKYFLVIQYPIKYDKIGIPIIKNINMQKYCKIFIIFNRLNFLF